MEEKYRGKNIDLGLLSGRIALFFGGKSFVTSTHQEREKIVITAIPKAFHGIGERVNVEVCGDPNDFSVKFLSGTHSRALIRFGSFASLITGGYFLLRGLKSQEEVEKLERKFWVYVDETVWFLLEHREP